MSTFAIEEPFLSKEPFGETRLLRWVAAGWVGEEVVTVVAMLGVYEMKGCHCVADDVIAILSHSQRCFLFTMTSLETHIQVLIFTM